MTEVEELRILNKMLKSRNKYYSNRHREISAQYDRLKKTYKNSNESMNLYKKKLQNVPLPFKCAPHNQYRDLLMINLSYAGMLIQHNLMTLHMPYTHYQLLAIAYNHEFMTTSILRESYKVICRHMKQIAVKLKFLEGKGYVKFIGELKQGQESIFLITPEGRRFVDKVNKSIMTQIRKHGTGISRKKAKEKD